MRAHEFITETIDGNPTTNSMGKPIHPTEEGIANFWNWFGDSKVVDKHGRPLVLFHGTFRNDETPLGFSEFLSNAGIWFSTSPEYASNWAKIIDIDKPDQTIGDWRVMPVYLKIINPIDLTAHEKIDPEMDLYKKSIVNKLQKKTHDGAFWEESYANRINYVVFDKTQIKSAVGNNGRFSPSAKITENNK